MLDEAADTVKSRDGSRLLLAVFGKHPAWSDHLEDIGIDSPSLAEFRRWLYVDGIRPNLDSGAWERLPAGRMLPEWNHRLLMVGPTGMILARLWATSDGRGRRAYPLVAATHLPTARLPADLGPLFDALDATGVQCAAALTQDEVRAAVLQGVGFLGQAVKSLAPQAPEGPGGEERLRFLDSPEMGPGRAGFERLIHVMTGELAAFAPGGKRKRTCNPFPRGFRVPLPRGRGGEAVLLWHAFFQPHLAAEVLWSAVHAVDQPWADLIVGEPDADQVFRFRASLEEIPAVCDIPYNIPRETLETAARIIHQFGHPPFRVSALQEKGDENPRSRFLGSLRGRLFGGD